VHFTFRILDFCSRNWLLIHVASYLLLFSTVWPIFLFLLRVNMLTAEVGGFLISNRCICQRFILSHLSSRDHTLCLDIHFFMTSFRESNIKLFSVKILVGEILPWCDKKSTSSINVRADRVFSFFLNLSREVCRMNFFNPKKDFCNQFNWTYSIIIIDIAL